MLQEERHLYSSSLGSMASNSSGVSGAGASPKTQRKHLVSTNMILCDSQPSCGNLLPTTQLAVGRCCPMYTNLCAAMQELHKCEPFSTCALGNSPCLAAVACADVRVTKPFTELGLCFSFNVRIEHPPDGGCFPQQRATLVVCIPVLMACCRFRHRNHLELRVQRHLTRGVKGQEGCAPSP